MKARLVYENESIKTLDVNIVNENGNTEIKMIIE